VTVKRQLVLILGWVLTGAAYLALAWQQVRYGIEYDEGTSLNVINNFA
jgi:hypothetical protein